MSNAHLVKRRDSRAATGRPPAVPAKAKVAIAALLEMLERDLEAAAKIACLTVKQLKTYLKRPDVRRYVMEERQVILDATCAGNPVALKAIRDTSPNAMARVQAIRTLEALEERMDKETGSRELPASGDCVRDRGRPYREDDRTVATHHRTWSLRWTQSWTNRTKRAIICQHEV